jgi:hypothetical protein
MKIYFLLVVLILGSAQHSPAQILPYDTLKVMTYNVLNYGFEDPQYCPTLLTASKDAWLRTILHYEAPDILGLEKMAAYPESITTDSIIHQVLDAVCQGCFANTPYTNYSGYEKENMLYYNTQKIAWLSTTTIYSGDSNISDINLHRLFYKSPSLAISHDTIFLNIILAHLESGSGSAQERAVEITGTMNWLNSHVSAVGNYIFMGDFNTQSSNESCFQQMINSTNANTTFYDPANQPGDWNYSPKLFGQYLTQSTRTSDPGDCGATGGMVNRYDHILCTKYLMDGTDSLRYIDSTFTVIGQDGLHVGHSLVDAPQNTSVPADELNALYYMSEHLPVMLRLAVGGPQPAPSAIASNTISAEEEWTYNKLVSDKLNILHKENNTPMLPGAYTASIYDITGASILHAALNTYTNNTINLTQITPGIYLLKICNNNGQALNGKFVKVSR